MVLEESDEELIESCRRGESEAFRALFERHKDKVYSIALRFSGFRGEASFSSWLYRLVVNSCLDRKRKSRRLRPLLDEALAMVRSPETGAFDEMLRAELSGHLQTVVASLSDEQRVLLVLRYTQSLSYDEIAEILGTSNGTIASRLNRLHRTLARRLSRFRKDGKRG